MSQDIAPFELEMDVVALIAQEVAIRFSM